jgi:hypothetical protein
VDLVRTDASEEHLASIISLFLRSLLQLLFTASVAPSSPILLTLVMEGIHSSETVVTRTTRHHIPVIDILQLTA